MAARAAAADPPPVVDVHLELLAAPDCATAGQLLARVAARSQRIRFGAAGAGVFELRVEIAPGPHDTQIGRLWLVEPNGRRSGRRLTAPTCAETIDAVALVAALSLDPSYTPPPDAPRAHDLPAETTGEVGATPTAAVEAAVDRSSSTPPRRAADRSPTDARAGTDARPGTDYRSAARADNPATPNDAEPAGANEPAPIPARRRFGGGVAARVISGPAPHPMPAIAVSLFAALDRPSIWSPALRLTLQHGWQNGDEEPGGTADFALDAVTLDLCLLRLSVTALDLRACATATAGQLSASGSDTYSPASQARPFLALGGTAILEIALGHWIELSGAVGAAETPIRDAFEFSPEVFHRVSATTLTFELGAGVRFP